MSFYDLFKNLLGIPNNIPDDFNRDRFTDNDDEYYENQFSGPQNEDIWRESEGGDEDRMGFNVFSDPLEMHRYFEHQMNVMMKSFRGATSFFTLPPDLQAPQSDVPQDEMSQKNLRDHFLKPGYENTRESKGSSEKSDSVVDGKVNLDDLDTLLRDKPRQQLTPFQGQQTPQFRTFGQSISTQTVRRPDGTVETTQTRKDNAGNVETTVTKQQGDKRYTVTVRTDKNGRQERTEDMVNLDEKEVSKFTQKRQPNEETDLNKLFPFDKFFK